MEGRDKKHSQLSIFVLDHKPTTPAHREWTTDWVQLPFRSSQSQLSYMILFVLVQNQNLGGSVKLYQKFNITDTAEHAAPCSESPYGKCKSLQMAVSAPLPDTWSSTPLWSIRVALTLLVAGSKLVTDSIAGCFFPRYS